MKPTPQQIETAKQILTNAGFCVDSLWHVDDVKNSYQCTDEQAMEILSKSLDHEMNMSAIFDEIHFQAEFTYNLKSKA
jgi:hypothetical protein